MKIVGIRNQQTALSWRIRSASETVLVRGPKGKGPERSGDSIRLGSMSSSQWGLHLDFGAVLTVEETRGE
ncbi:hypothetical protein CFAM422_003713 [Trichoderma lentiforme]|uniref:Uncharacterized protein n=1 Tax=Trichoderma lentiforme TaxID=1567552 RepID=A0A9P4XK53_9HYPO|nr:hypothetical protein CFAM422_003713 [Trichoderma lentiforme]